MERTTITNHLRLLKLPEEVRTLVADGKLSMGHAKVILGIDSQSQQSGIAAKAADEGLSVRELERLLKGGKEKNHSLAGKSAGKKPQLADPNIADLEDRLSKSLGTKVRVKHKGKKVGMLHIEYYSLEQLEGLLEKMF